MRRAFLCHSSQDKEYVRILASKLTRARVIFDELAFEPGQDFRVEISRHLGSSGLFVFVASRKALESAWCRYEIDEAELKAMEGGIQGQLTLIIDEDISYSELPRWLARARVLIQTRPSQAARDIEHTLLALSPIEDRQPLVGREDDLRKFRENLSPSRGPVPQVFIVYGLQGVGRRSLLSRASHDNLDLTLGPFFEIDSAQRLEDFYLLLLDETADLDTRRRMKDELEAFRGLSADRKIREVVTRLKMLCESRTVPCFVDTGGLLDSDGFIAEVWQSVIQEFVASTRDEYIAIVSRRRPHVDDSESDASLILRTDPLSDEATLTLLRQLLRKQKITYTENEIAELCEYLDGYPPAVYAAIVLADLHGFDLLLADKRELIEFKAKSFQRFLNELELSPDEWLTLQYLAGERQLSFAVLATALDMDDEYLSDILRKLIDQSLVQTRDRTLGISAPIRDSLFRLKGYLGTERYQNIALRLSESFWTDEAPAPTLAVIDATIHAAALSDTEVPDRLDPLVRGSTLERISLENYRRGDYRAALEYGLRGKVLVNGDSAGLRETRFKSYVRLERWQDADQELASIEKAGDRFYYFLKGFKLRRQREMLAAISALRSALETGDRRTAVRREMAFCLYVIGRFADAKIECLLARDRDPNNPFVLDLLVNIHLGLNEIPDAEAVLRELERVDVSERFIHHRRAVYWSALGDYPRALLEVERAIEVRHAALDAYALRAGILIRAGRLDEAAAALSDLTERFPDREHDLVIGLRVKSLVRQGKWREAMLVWKQLHRSDIPVHQGLLKAIYLTKAEDSNVSLVERQDAMERAEAIATDLQILELHYLFENLVEEDGNSEES
jgi:tetratricopeptide (TPR) repeat protein